MISEYNVGDPVQLDPDKTGNPMFARCIMTVTEPKSWGAQGYVQALGPATGTQDQRDELTQAARDVLAERHRQITAEGWTPDHDDEHTNCAMSRAAACYALDAAGYSTQHHSFWPWDWKLWKPGEPRRNLVKAASLILADIERIDRAAARAAKEVDHA